MVITNIKTKNKKGSHVGIMIATIIFIGFVIFLLYTFRSPFKIEADKKYLVESLEKSIDGEIEGNILIVTITNSTARGINEDCLIVQTSDYGLSPEYSYVFVEDEDNEGVDYLFDSGEIEVSWEEGNNFYKIYHSPEEINSNTLKSSLTCQAGVIGSVENQNYYFESKIMTFVGNYSTNYTNLKNILSFPRGNEFGFSFDFLNGTTVGAELVEVDFDFYIKDKDVYYFDTFGVKKRGVLTIFVW
jgi:hypothetical protein